ncbi:cobalt-precorrin-4/precorrin-4 C(11)-methyltransferase [Kutzneria buriramensis]|uniref:Precorrin-4/cobalt-precorrin-4 C11-methyltransferase n=1 Tax=Kutzneria buriramensis TaxID=1045776 RepID=A0A3E0I0G9_9PSEU|nr:cobalt-precorrin-4/precorrin-4 C(11)-methyltransferase [Kutzneria buriramensis]REH52224.1 precorrin-4/cobalt-precorrin-4 C11-methyltransferase [Kutzneria buriramensis]
MKSGLVSFVGAGPGAADLITVRGARRLADADVVVWAPSLVDAECVREHVRADAELIDLSRTGGDDVVELFRRAARDKLQVVRMITGDPVLWGAVRDQVDACRRIGVETEIVPGVSQVSAAVSAVGRELTDVDQSVILTRVDATALPDATQIRQLAGHGATMGVFVAAARTAQLVEELTEGGYGADTPVVVAYKTTWPDELLLNTTLGELEATVKQRKLWRHTLFLVGKAMAPGTKARYRRTESAEPVEEALEPGSERAARRTSWSARAGRTNRIAAARSEVPVQASGETSQAAWRAVHNWQADARTKAPAPKAAAKQPDADQTSLDDVAAEEPQKVTVSPAAIKPAAPRTTARTNQTGATKPTAKQQPAKARTTQAKRTRKSG